MPITLTFVALSYGINLEKVIFSVLALIVIRLFFEFSNCGDHTINITFRDLLKEFMIWSRLSILAMISSVGWDSMIWFEGVSLVSEDKSVLDLRDRADGGGLNS